MNLEKSFDRGLEYFSKKKTQRLVSSALTFLIVVEGKKSEVNYFNALRDRLRLSNVEIVHPGATDTLSLVEYAILKRDERIEQASRSLTVSSYDEIWIVSDLEGAGSSRRECVKKAKRLGSGQNIEFAFSDPCFEYWLLLHYQQTASPSLKNCKKVIERLKIYWPAYVKGINPSDGLMENIRIAVTNAEYCRRHHKGCPSTQVDILVRKLNLATRPYYKILP